MKWLLRNPHKLSMTITLHDNGLIEVRFPALQECFGIGLSRDEAIFHCAESIVAKLKPFVSAVVAGNRSFKESSNEPSA